MRCVDNAGFVYCGAAKPSINKAIHVPQRKIHTPKWLEPYLNPCTDRLPSRAIAISKTNALPDTKFHGLKYRCLQQCQQLVGKRVAASGLIKPLIKTSTLSPVRILLAQKNALHRPTGEWAASRGVRLKVLSSCIRVRSSDAQKLKCYLVQN